MVRQQPGGVIHRLKRRPVSMRISVVRPRAAAIGILLLSASTGFESAAIAQVRRLEVAAVLDAYAQGRYDEALAPMRYLSRDAARDFRQQLVLRGVQWVDALAVDRPRRERNEPQRVLPEATGSVGVPPESP